MPDSPRWCETCGAWGDHHTDKHVEEDYKGWVIAEQVVGTGTTERQKRVLVVYRANGGYADSEGPTLYSREELEQFVTDLYQHADGVWDADH